MIGDRCLTRVVGFAALLGLTSCVDESTGPGSPPTRTGDGVTGTDEFRAQRDAMVEQLRSVIDDERVLRAMASVPRHEFVDARYRSRAYHLYAPLPIDEDQRISAPDVVAIMTEALKLRGGERVLEIGTGSGYQAAVLGELVGEVYTVEIRPALAESARQRLEALKARGLLSYNYIEVITGNGYEGHAEKAQYDAIVVTAAPKRTPVALLNQLKPGGRMVLPVGGFLQELQVIQKLEDGGLKEETVLPVQFMPMVHEAESGGR